MSGFPEESYHSMNSSSHSLDLEDLTMTREARRIKITRPVFVNYGLRSMMIRMDMEDTFAVVKKVVEEKTGIPVDEQVLSLQNSGKIVCDEYTLRNYGYMGGAFCNLSKAN